MYLIIIKALNSRYSYQYSYCPRCEWAITLLQYKCKTTKCHLCKVYIF